MLSRSLLLSLLKMTCNLSQADKRMRRAILHSSHKSAVIHILLLFSSPLISSPFFSSSLCSFPSLGFDSGCTEMKENRKTRHKAPQTKSHFLALSDVIFSQSDYLAFWIHPSLAFGGSHCQGSGLLQMRFIRQIPSRPPFAPLGTNGWNGDYTLLIKTNRMRTSTTICVTTGVIAFDQNEILDRTTTKNTKNSLIWWYNICQGPNNNTP